MVCPCSIKFSFNMDTYLDILQIWERLKFSPFDLTHPTKITNKWVLLSGWLQLTLWWCVYVAVHMNEQVHKKKYHVQGVPPICWQLRAKFWKSKNHICQKVNPFFSEFDTFFYVQFKNTSNLIFSSFKVPSKSFFSKNFKTGLTFWHMWFFNFQNSVRSCQHIVGTPCISKSY